MGELIYWGGFFGCIIYSLYIGIDEEFLNQDSGIVLISIILLIIYSFAWPLFWPFIFYTHKKEKTDNMNKIKLHEAFNNKYSTIQNTNDQVSSKIITNTPPNFIDFNSEIKELKSQIELPKINNENSLSDEKNKKAIILKDTNEVLRDQIKLNKKKEVKKLPKGSTPTAYQCLKCFYKWNRNPNLRCAMCSEFGPYKPHNGKLG